MTLNDLSRVQLAVFACKAAGPNASLEMMKAICYVMRNRVRAGWGDWIEVIETADQHAGNEPVPVKLDSTNRNLQRLLRDIDDVFYAQSGSYQSCGSDTIEAAMGEQGTGADKRGALLYWCRIGQPYRPWFEENILKDQKNHRMRMPMGLMLFFE